MVAVRFVLAIWLAVFAIQGTELLASVIPDECVEDTRGSATDPCPESCARCVCCARLPVFLPHLAAALPTDPVVTPAPLPPLGRFTSPQPRGILHVPKVAL